ncbi:MAG: hypothetical protein A2284_07435 [Deltaproteobacteria bacterium RIFOXYA12_FULL_61_11]|nr:MAG: hypothetical protein A2284_07435 [Deltaproteobacteria bacterium RIFOXYA12_FULL_61_11]
MFHRLPPLVLGSLTILLVISNILLFTPMVYLVGLLKVIFRDERTRAKLVRFLEYLCEGWVQGNDLILRLTQDLRWDIRGNEGLRRAAWYFVVSNHQSWVDIVVLQHVLNRRIPYPKFFLKKELRKIPILGFAWQTLDYPFMQRHSRAALEAKPELAGQDLAVTFEACRKFSLVPTTVLNFLEGTRFTPAKHRTQESPYRHLLRPKAGGFAFVLTAMGQRFHSLLDVTIAYPGGRPTFWELCSGKVHEVVVRVEQRELPAEFLTGDYQGDPVFRQRFQTFVNQLWEHKDELLGTLLPSPDQPRSGK